MKLYYIILSYLTISKITSLAIESKSMNSIDLINGNKDITTSKIQGKVNKDLSLNLIDEMKNKKKKEDSEGYSVFDYFLLSGLILFSAILAGLTIGLMSLDATNLAILKKSGTENEKRYASIIEPIRKNPHFLLCTLLLANTVVNESLPILLDPIIGSGWKAILCSTALIVLFGEIIPQAICSRFGLYIGAKFAWLVQLLMIILSPLAWPIAKLLDMILGKNHGTNYKKSQLKELVQLHDKVLIPEEVRIIKGVLDLREKMAYSIMTELKNTFALDYDAILDKDHIDKIIAKGHSRIPVYRYQRSNLIGVILVKRLIALKHRIPVYKLPLSPLPTFSPETPLFEALAFFQQGKSHMAKIAYANGEAMGILTLEDVLEELIGGEILDETDEYLSMETKVKVTRPLSANLQLLPKASKSCFCSPRLSPNLFPSSPLPTLVLDSVELDKENSNNKEYQNSSKPSNQYKLKAKTAFDYYRLTEAQEGDLVLITTMPGHSFVGTIIEPMKQDSKEFSNTNTRSRRNSGSNLTKISPLLVIPKVDVPRKEPKYHLVDMPKKLNNEQEGALDLKYEGNTPGELKRKIEVGVEINEKTPLLNRDKQ